MSIIHLIWSIVNMEYYQMKHFIRKSNLYLYECEYKYYITLNILYSKKQIQKEINLFYIFRLLVYLSHF